MTTATRYETTPCGLRKGVDFADQLDHVRHFVRDLIDALGGHVEVYNGKSLTVAMPNGHRHGLLKSVLSEIGLYPGESWRFPLGSDAPPNHLRHGGYWYFTNFTIDQ